jgi:ribonucleotide monophosphatase NagD (HAD superfamily)
LNAYCCVQPNFGICFDIDGVLARGSVAIPAAQRGFRKLLSDEGLTFKYPVAFVTNALNLNQDKANQLSAWFGVTVSSAGRM